MKALAGAARGRRLRLSTARHHVYQAPSVVNAGSTGLDVTIARVSADNVHLVEGFREAAVATVFRRFLDEGQVGVYAIHEGRAVGHVWAIPGGLSRRRANGYFPLRRGEALIHYAHVDPGFRGRSVFGLMTAELVDLVRGELTCPHILVDAEVANDPSNRALRGMGFVHIGSDLVVGVGGRGLVRCFRAVEMPGVPGGW